MRRVFIVLQFRSCVRWKISLIFSVVSESTIGRWMRAAVLHFSVLVGSANAGWMQWSCFSELFFLAIITWIHNKKQSAFLQLCSIAKAGPLSFQFCNYTFFFLNSSPGINEGSYFCQTELIFLRSPAGTWAEHSWTKTPELIIVSCLLCGTSCTDWLFLLSQPHQQSTAKPIALKSEPVFIIWLVLF